MEKNDKIRIIKDIKTSSRLMKQVRTMLDNTANKIIADDCNSVCASNIKMLVKAIDNTQYSVTLTDNIEAFKREQKFGGYQLELFD